MYFYCTTKIKNYYKVGIASSLVRIKKRLASYRTTNPNTKINFFSDIGSMDKEIEWSFKNKFEEFRIEKSECYELDFDIIYRHFLKFQHKFKKLHHFWNAGYYYISEYYADKSIYEFDVCDFTETALKDTRFGYYKNFIPIAYLSDSGRETDKKGNYTFQLNILDINKIDLKKFRYQKYRTHLKEKFWGQTYGYIGSEIDKFCEENFTTKLKFKAVHQHHLYHIAGGKIFDIFNRKHKSLTKKYPEDPIGCLYWEKPEQKSITRNKSIYLTKKIISKFSGKHDLDAVLSSVSSSIPRNDPKINLQTFRRIVDRFLLRSPRSTKKVFTDIENIIDKEIKKIDKYEEINLALEKQDKKIQINKKHLKIVK